MKISRSGMILIKSFEGFRPRAIRRADGSWVIGYGHTQSARKGARVTEAEAELLLQYDLIPVARAVSEKVERPLNQHQFDAIASFAFSVGVERFAASDVLRRLNTGATRSAAEALGRWSDPDPVDLGQRRRAAERALFNAPPEASVTLAELLSAPLPPPPTPAFVSSAPTPGRATAEPESSLLAAHAVPAANDGAVVLRQPIDAEVIDDGPDAEAAGATTPIAPVETVPASDDAVAAPEPDPASDDHHPAGLASALAYLNRPADAAGPTATTPPPAAPVEPEPAAEPVSDIALEAPIPAPSAETGPALETAPDTPASDGVQPETIEAQAAPEDEPSAAVEVDTASEDAPAEPVAAYVGSGIVETAFESAPPVVEVELEPLQPIPADAVEVDPVPLTDEPADLQAYQPHAGPSAPEEEPLTLEPAALTDATEGDASALSLATPSDAADMLTLTPVEDDTALTFDRPVWGAADREPVDTAQTPLFDEEGAVTAQLGPILRSEVAEEPPARFSWGGTAAYLVMGGFGMICFGVAMAAFRLASRRVPDNSEPLMIAWMLAIMGVACVGVAAWSLYRRFGREEPPTHPDID